MEKYIQKIRTTSGDLKIDYNALGNLPDVALSGHTHVSNDLTNAVEINKGGTGATDAPTARRNLGITPENIGASATNHGHSLVDSNITDVLPIEKGGTGASDAATVLSKLGAVSESDFYGTTIKEGSAVTANCFKNSGISALVSYDPIQSGSDDPSPSNVRKISGRTAFKVMRSGKNLISTPPEIPALRNATYSYDAPNGTFTLTKGAESMWGQMGYTLRMDAAQFAGRKLTLSCADASSTYADDEPRIYILKQDKTTTINRMSLNTGANSLTFTVPQGVTALYLIIRIDQNKTAPKGTVLTVRGLQLEVGEAATEFEPYASDTFTITSDQTVYGGTLDWMTGKLIVEWGYKAFDGTENWVIEGSTTDNPYFILSNAIDIGAGTMLADVGICSHFPFVNLSTITNNQGINGRGKGVFLRWSTLFSTVAELKSYLVGQNAAGTPVQIAYKLATPTEIQLTPQMINALDGVNTIYSDGYFMRVKFGLPSTDNLCGTVLVSNGGTGASDPATARSNLEITPKNIGASPVDHSHALTDTSITDVLPVKKGGTGASDPLIARNNLGIKYGTELPDTANNGDFFFLYTDNELQDKI